MALPLPVPTIVSQPYWAAAADGRLELQWCRSCSQWVHYPRGACPRCHGRELEFRAVSGRGTVYSHSTVRTPGGFPSYAERVPYTVVLVELDEGPRLIANLLDDREPRVGDRVELTFEQRDGYALPQFTLVEASQG